MPHSPILLREAPFDRLQRLLAERRQRLLPAAPLLPAASVAVVLRPAPGGPQLLLIRRAERSGDPWSGHMALPGGRRDPGDRDAEATAARETAEEVGIDLHAGGRLLGALDEIRPVSQRAPKILVSPFVYLVPADAEARPNAEVALALWVPVTELSAPDAVTEYLYALEDGGSVTFPAYGTGGHLIWGLTYRILTGFFRVYQEALHAGES